MVGRLPAVRRSRARTPSRSFDPERADSLLVCSLEDGLVVVFAVAVAIAFRHHDGIQRKHHCRQIIDLLDSIQNQSRITMARQANVADQSLILGVPNRRQRAVVARDLLEFGLILEAVDLVEIDVVDAEAIQRALEFVARAS